MKATVYIKWSMVAPYTIEVPDGTPADEIYDLVSEEVTEDMLLSMPEATVSSDSFVVDRSILSTGQTEEGKNFSDRLKSLFFNKLECVHCEKEFISKNKEQAYCSECLEIYFDCGCRRPYCLCYTR